MHLNLDLNNYQFIISKFTNNKFDMKVFFCGIYKIRQITEIF